MESGLEGDIDKLEQTLKQLRSDREKNKIVILETEKMILQYKLDIKTKELDKMKSKISTLKNMKISINDVEIMQTGIKLLKQLAVHQRNLRLNNERENDKTYIEIIKLLKQLAVHQRNLILNNNIYIKF